MRVMAGALIALTVAVPGAFGVDREFHDVVSAIAYEFRTRPVHIPFLGLVNMVAFVARPAGTSHFNIAVFEHLDARDRRGRDLRETIATAVGKTWTPFVQVHSRRSGKQETVLVYMRNEGSHCRLLVTAIERDEATVVEMRLNPEALQRWISSPRDTARSNHGTAGIAE